MEPGRVFHTNPDLTGRNCIFFHFLDPKFLDFQVPDIQICRNLAWAWPGPGLGRVWAGLGMAEPRTGLGWALGGDPRVSRVGPSGGPGGPRLGQLERSRFEPRRIKQQGCTRQKCNVATDRLGLPHLAHLLQRTPPKPTRR